MYRAIGANTNSFMAKCVANTAKCRNDLTRLILLMLYGVQHWRLNCIIYPEKHNGTILLMYEAHTKQLATPPSYDGPNDYSNPRRLEG